MSRDNPESQEEADYWDNVEYAEKEEHEANLAAEAEAMAKMEQQDLEAEVELQQEIEELAEQLHIWYLEATKQFNPDSYNEKAQKAYKDLTEEQKDIDRYIAKKILEKF